MKLDVRRYNINTVPVCFPSSSSRCSRLHGQQFTDYQLLVVLVTLIPFVVDSGVKWHCSVLTAVE